MKCRTGSVEERIATNVPTDDNITSDMTPGPKCSLVKKGKSWMDSRQPGKCFEVSIRPLEERICPKLQL